MRSTMSKALFFIGGACAALSGIYFSEAKRTDVASLVASESRLLMLEAPQGQPLSEDLVYEWRAFGEYLTQRPEFASRKSVALHRLTATSFSSSTNQPVLRVCISLLMHDPDDSQRITSPTCDTVAYDSGFNFEAELQDNTSGNVAVNVWTDAPLLVNKQIDEVFSLFDQGLVHLSLRSI